MNRPEVKYINGGVKRGACVRISVPKSPYMTKDQWVELNRAEARKVRDELNRFLEGEAVGT